MKKLHGLPIAIFGLLAIGYWLLPLSALAAPDFSAQKQITNQNLQTLINYNERLKLRAKYLSDKPERDYIDQEVSGRLQNLHRWQDDIRTATSSSTLEKINIHLRQLKSTTPSTDLSENSIDTTLVKASLSRLENNLIPAARDKTRRVELLLSQKEKTGGSLPNARRLILDATTKITNANQITLTLKTELALKSALPPAKIAEARNKIKTAQTQLEAAYRSLLLVVDSLNSPARK